MPHQQGVMFVWGVQTASVCRLGRFILYGTSSPGIDDTIGYMKGPSPLAEGTFEFIFDIMLNRHFELKCCFVLKIRLFIMLKRCSVAC